MRQPPPPGLSVRRGDIDKGDIVMGREFANAGPRESATLDGIPARSFPRPGNGLIGGKLSSPDRVARVVSCGLEEATLGAKKLPLATEFWVGDEDLLVAFVLVAAAALTSFEKVLAIRSGDFGGADIDRRGGAVAGVVAGCATPSPILPSAVASTILEPIVLSGDRRPAKPGVPGVELDIGGCVANRGTTGIGRS